MSKSILNTSVVTDTDPSFVIDAITREITNPKGKKRVLMQNDHNSERLTFEIPRFIEGRDVAKCNLVQVCYINTAAGSRRNESGVYTVNDLNVYPFVNDVLRCSWLISQNATSLEGNLSFMLRFAEVNDAGEVLYAWHTSVYKDISVVESIESAQDFSVKYIDIIQQWKMSVMEELQVYSDVTVQEQIKTANAELEARVNNLLGSLQEGSTTSDAELIDGRVGGDGVTYSNIGEAIRGQYANAAKYNKNAVVFINKQPSAVKDETKLTVTLPATTHVYINSKIYQFTDITVSCEHNNAALYFLVFKPESNEVELIHHSSQISLDRVVIGCVQNDIVMMNTIGHNIDAFTIDSYNSITPKIWCDNMNATCNYSVASDTDYRVIVTLPSFYVVSRACRFVAARTIDMTIYKAIAYRIVYNSDTDDMTLVGFNSKVPSGYMNVGYAHTVRGVFLNDCSHLSKDRGLALSALIMGAAGKFVEFDSVNKTVTFPTDTLIQVNKTGTPVYYQLSTDKANNTVSYAEQTSTALIIMFNTLTEKLEVTNYGYAIYAHQIPVATFRTNCGAVSILAPYTWNGRPFNMTAEDLNMPEMVDYIRDFNVKSINHRGYCWEAPENTLSAYKLSAKKGFEYVECDVLFTSDDVPVLLHDVSIDRTSDGTGNIYEMTLEQARAYDYGSWFSDKYVGEQIPTFEEFMVLCKKLALHPYIEMKSVSGTTQAQIESLVDVVKRTGMKGKVSYISFDPTLLGYIKNKDPEARLGYVTNDILADNITTAQGLKTDKNNVFINTSYTAIADDTVNMCVDADIPLEVWTMNSQEWIESMNPYISGVSSDWLHAGRTLFNTNL